MNLTKIKRALPQEGEIWKCGWYGRGDLYCIIGIENRGSDNTPVVVYKSLRTSKILSRPVEEFMEIIGNRYHFDKIRVVL